MLLWKLHQLPLNFVEGQSTASSVPADSFSRHTGIDSRHMTCDKYYTVPQIAETNLTQS